MSEDGACFRAPALALGLASHVPLRREGDAVVAEFVLREGETAEFVLRQIDPCMLKTIDAIMRPPDEGGLLSDSLVYRYDPERTKDGLKGTEGTFNMCTFWLVEALTRAGRVDEERLGQARLIFERMLGYADHLGLYAEGAGPRGQALGNFPRAFTYLTLISAAFNLDRTRGSRE